jgi:hypothetical protein
MCPGDATGYIAGCYTGTLALDMANPDRPGRGEVSLYGGEDV